MKIEVVEGPTGLVLIHVLRSARLACEAAYNRFLIKHGLTYWNLIIRASFISQSIIAQSIAPDGLASNEVEIREISEISLTLTQLLEFELSRWLGHAAAHASDTQ
jgi:hypothetical protein